MPDQDAVQRGAHGQFLTGQAPRSPGRPKGMTEADQIRLAIEPKKAAILAKLLELAELGDPRSIELVLKYLAPPARPDAERISVPGLRDAKTLGEKAECILASVSTGAISVEAGEKALRMLDVLARAVTLDEHDRRLAAIETGRTVQALPPANVVPDDDLDLA